MAGAEDHSTVKDLSAKILSCCISASVTGKEILVSFML